LVALDSRTGRELWTRRVASWVHGDPAIYRNRVFVTAGRFPKYARGGLQALDLKTGALAWEFPTASAVMPSPLIDTLARSVMIAGVDAALYTLDLATGRLRHAWGLQTSVYMSSPHADSSGVVYVGSENRVTAYSASSGASIWSARLPQFTY